MRNRHTYCIKNKKEFTEKLVFWAKKYKHSCLLDSNKQSFKMPKDYLEYEFLFGVGAHKICCPENNSFERLIAPGKGRKHDEICTYVGQYRKK